MKKPNSVFFALLSLLLALPGFSQLETGYPLPFLEQWNTGTFETNNWIAESQNWSINGNEGNPDPCAEFTWDPILSDYFISLESYTLLADSMTEGMIYLDYDIKLDNVNPTGTEEMLVQVWNWDSQEWSTVSAYSNATGSFDWNSEHLNITEQAMGAVFKIRFTASGENSLNILAWYVDNIIVYRDCKSPYDLRVYGSYYYQGIVLEWEETSGPEYKWIEWDDGDNSGNSIGIGSEIEFDVASRWTPSQLTDYQGYKITQIAFFPVEAQASYIVRVWTGTNAVNLVVNQPVTDPTIGQWNYITLNSPQMLDISQELWVGYNINTPTGYPAGVDDGPAIDGYGNMMNFGRWQTLLQINPELDYNWNIKTYLHQTLSNDSVSKYGIYRSDIFGQYFLRAYTDTNFYVDDSALCETVDLHCYMVTALYLSDMDSCESSFSNESCEFCPEIGIKDVNIGLNIAIYPNPASDLLHVESPERIQSIFIYDSKGEKVIWWEGGKVGKVEIPVRGLAPGLYLVKVETERELIMRKVLIMR